MTIIFDMNNQTAFSCPFLIWVNIIIDYMNISDSFNHLHLKIRTLNLSLYCETLVQYRTFLLHCINKLYHTCRSAVLDMLQHVPRNLYLIPYYLVLYRYTCTFYLLFLYSFEIRSTIVKKIFVHSQLKYLCT